MVSDKTIHKAFRIRIHKTLFLNKNPMEKFFNKFTIYKNYYILALNFHRWKSQCDFSLNFDNWCTKSRVHRVIVVQEQLELTNVYTENKRKMKVEYSYP